MNKYNLPRPHFSWSQLHTIETSEKKYIDHYIKGKKSFTTKEMEYGKQFADSEDMDEDKQTEVLLELVYEGVKNISYLDELDGETVIEKKTGKTPWNQERVDKHGQLDFYAWMYFEIYGKIPPVKLVWIETQEVDGKITPTGNIHYFDRTITPEDISNIKQRVLNAYKRITELMEAEVDTGVVALCDEYAQLELQRKQIEDKQKELKEIIIPAVHKAGLIETDRYSVTARKGTRVYEYSQDFLAYKKNFDDMKKEAEKTSPFYEKEGSMTFTLKK
jgi:hypothetical protein